MMPMLDPFAGLVNPLLGFDGRQNAAMPKGVKKTPKIPGFTRTIIAENLKRLMAKHYAAHLWVDMTHFRV